MTSILNRLKEESTWRGLITLSALAGITISPEQTEAIVTAGVAVISAVWIFKSE